MSAEKPEYNPPLEDRSDDQLAGNRQHLADLQKWLAETSKGSAIDGWLQVREKLDRDEAALMEELVRRAGE